MIVRIILGLLGLWVLASASKSYEGYKVYNVDLTSKNQTQIVDDLKKYFIWNNAQLMSKDLRIMVSPDQEAEFVAYTKTAGLNASVTIANIQELIDAQLKPANTCSCSLGSFNWTQYHTLAEIHAWLDELAELFCGYVTTVNIGTSHEGRPLKGIIIDIKAGKRGDKPLIGMIEGGLHAREWISPATVTWIIKEFLTSEDPNVRIIADAFIWHIFPVTNPDGYVYTFDGDRMWRKNRNPANFVTCNDPDMGNGVDLNRNFNYLWMTAGASADPCDSTYAGPSEASERETQALSNHVLSLKKKGNFLYYFAFHSYSQVILIPFSHLTGVDVRQTSNYAALYEIATRGVAKIKAKHGTSYIVGTAKEMRLKTSGSSIDWVKGVAEVPITFLFELRDQGRNGFFLPPEEIIPNNEEIMTCLIEMDKTTRKLGYYSGAGTVLASVNSLLASVMFVILMQ